MVVKAAGEVSAAEMEEINRYTRRAYGPEEVYTFSLVLCDNEIDRDYERFSVESLKKLRELFLGKTCIFDHERRSANQTARIYHTEVKEREGETTQAGEVLTQLTARAYLPRTKGSEETIELIESGILKEVSVSCSVKRAVCSVCGKEKCQHEKGKVYGGKTAHRVLLDPSDAYECSFVAVPAQRGAGVVKAKGQTVEKLLEGSGGETRITKAQAQEIGRRFRELSEKARWGETYHQELEREVLKYSGLIQPEVPRSVMESVVKSLDVGELAAMQRAYRSMAEKALPLSPQLLPRKKRDQEGPNREFLI